ncbi:MAG TPA: CbiX/SirB N-terminal domain-containing protein [Phycisphaerae bacterium]|nr:CbiX/SirB N-terminal domain-containing protein [Phycisphaerae bacterium]
MTHQRDTQTIGVILVDHGSKFPAANDMLNDVVELFRRISSYAVVEPAHMELAQPDIAAAFAACVRQGATHVVVHPYFLSPGRHSTTDIPRLVQQAAAAHPGISFQVTQPLGLDQKIADVILQRVNEGLQTSSIQT